MLSKKVYKHQKSIHTTVFTTEIEANDNGLVLLERHEKTHQSPTLQIDLDNEKKPRRSSKLRNGNVVKKEAGHA